MMGPSLESDSAKGKKKSSAESPEAHGLIGGLTPERADEIPRLIAEKTTLREGLLKTWKEKFAELKKLKAEQDDEKLLVARLEAGGHMKRGTEDAKEADLNAMDRFSEAARDAQKYLDDAKSLRQEIEELTAELRDEGN